MTWDLGAGLEGRAVIVTGACGGIGRAVAHALASAGARIAAVDLDGARVDEIVADLPGDGHLARAVDLARVDDHGALVQDVVDHFGRLDVLAHVAAVLRRSPSVDDVTEADWDLQHDVNLRAAFFLNRAAAAAMRQAGRGGRIVNFSSQGWWTGGFGGSVVYAAAKGGIVSMSRGLARTFAPDNITVNVIAPGGVDTPMLRDGMADEAMAAFVAQIPLGRLARPEEMAGAVVFLASEHASYITGATINISGGQLMY